MKRVTTASGAVYDIDEDTRTFVRHQGKTPVSGDPDGSLTEVATRYDEVYGPELGERMLFRFRCAGYFSLRTMPVVSIETVV